MKSIKRMIKSSVVIGACMAMVAPLFGVFSQTLETKYLVEKGLSIDVEGTGTFFMGVRIPLTVESFNLTAVDPAATEELMRSDDKMVWSLDGEKSYILVFGNTKYGTAKFKDVKLKDLETPRTLTVPTEPGTYEITATFSLEKEKPKTPGFTYQLQGVTWTYTGDVYYLKVSNVRAEERVVESEKIATLVGKGNVPVFVGEGGEIQIGKTGIKYGIKMLKKVPNVVGKDKPVGLPPGNKVTFLGYKDRGAQVEVVDAVGQALSPRVVMDVKAGISPEKGEVTIGGNIYKVTLALAEGTYTINVTTGTEDIRYYMVTGKAVFDRAVAQQTPMPKPVPFQPSVADKAETSPPVFMEGDSTFELGDKKFTLSIDPMEGFLHTAVKDLTLYYDAGSILGYSTSESELRLKDTDGIQYESKKLGEPLEKKWAAGGYAYDIAVVTERKSHKIEDKDVSVYIVKIIKKEATLGQPMPTPKPVPAPDKQQVSLLPALFLYREIKKEGRVYTVDLPNKKPSLVLPGYAKFVGFKDGTPLGLYKDGVKIGNIPFKVGSSRGPRGAVEIGGVYYTIHVVVEPAGIKTIDGAQVEVYTVILILKGLKE